MEAYGDLVDVFTTVEQLILEPILDTVIFGYTFLEISVAIFDHIQY